MGKGTDLTNDLLARALSPEEIRERHEAGRLRTDLIATLHGELVEPVRESEKPRVVERAPQQTWD